MSYPSWEAYRRATAPQDWAVGSEMSAHRMRHPNGNAELLAQLQLHFRLPQALAGARLRKEGPQRPPIEQQLPASTPAAAASAAGGQQHAAGKGDGVGGNPAEAERLFRLFLYLTQAQQALAYSTAIGRWRRQRSVPEAGTMGVLYWQLNDIWAVRVCVGWCIGCPEWAVYGRQ